MCQSGEKLQNPNSFVILRGLKGIRGDSEFFKNPLWTFLSPIHVLRNYQISDNSDVQILRYRVTDGRTNGRTDKRDSLGLNRLIAERPKSNERFSRKCMTNKRTNGRTGFLRSPTTSLRYQKCLRNPNFEPFEAQNDIFDSFWSKSGQFENGK